MNVLPVAILAVAFYVWTTYTEPLKSGEQSFTLYYWNKCSHCKKMMPEFDRLGRWVGEVKIRKVEASQNKEVNVRGFPTMIFRDAEGTEFVYDGERSYRALKEYISGKSVGSV